MTTLTVLLLRSFHGSKGDAGYGKLHPDSILPQTGDVTLTIKGDAVQVNTKVKSIFGKDMSKEDWQNVVGAPDGVALKVEISYGTLRISGKGGVVENMTRDFEKKNGGVSVHNIKLKVTPKAPAGVGTEIFTRQVVASIEHGFKRIDTTAAGSKDHKGFNGYYTWPRLGYNTALAKGTQDKLESHPALKGSKDLHDLFSRPGGAEWWKENGFEMNMSFDLGKGSMSRKALAAYLESKGRDTRGL